MRITGLDKTIKDLTGVCNTLKADVDKTENEIKVLETEKSGIDDKIEDLKLSIVDKKETIKHLETTLKGLNILDKGVVSKEKETDGLYETPNFTEVLVEKPEEGTNKVISSVEEVEEE